MASDNRAGTRPTPFRELEAAGFSQDLLELAALERALAFARLKCSPIRREMEILRRLRREGRCSELQRRAIDTICEREAAMALVAKGKRAAAKAAAKDKTEAIEGEGS